MAFFPPWKDTAAAAALAFATIDGLIVDNFAGGGGASTGIEAAVGRPVDYALNHDDKAIVMHRANHPDTIHICENIRRVRPADVAQGRRVGLAWFSPDCKHHSKAKGGKPRDKRIRGLAWVVVRWAFQVKPDVIMLENVEEFADWGPLRRGKPIRERRGEIFRLWIEKLELAGYTVEWRELRACDYGAPTIRKRLFLIARRDGKPIVWPERTHGPAGSLEVNAGLLQPYRTAAECIDWSIPCPSIFDRPKELADATLKRIAHGVMRFVVNCAQPFIVRTDMHKSNAGCVYAADEPIRTATTGGGFGVVAPHMTVFRNNSVGHDMRDPAKTATANSFEKKPGGAPPFGVVAAHLTKFSENSIGSSAEEPMHNVLAGGGKGAARHAEVAALLTQFKGSNRTGSGGDLRQPARTPTTGGGKGSPQGVVCAHIEQANTGMIGHRPSKPISTIVGKGCTQRIVETTLVANDALPPDQLARAVRTAAFLVKYYGSGETQVQGADEPLHAATAKARFAVVTVTIDATTYVLVDIGMRMLEPRELFNAQGFPPDYEIECANDNGGKPLSKAQQIEKCGNSVCPPMAEALVRANFPPAAEQRMAA